MIPVVLYEVSQTSLLKRKRYDGKFVAAKCSNISDGATLRWLDTVFQGQYLSSLNINYVAINKVLGKLPPQLY